jgi:tRNA(Ile)-lysidine synthase
LNPTSLIQKVQDTLVGESLVSPGQCVLVAVSGGPDSTALLHILHSLRETLGLRLHVAHFNHRLRGEASRGDEIFVAGLAEGLGLPLLVGSAENRPAGADRGVSPEAALREVRYRFLEEAADRAGADRIATGHTLDDQAETVLMRLLQGAGPGGLGGIRLARGRVIRPLLGCRRRELAAYLDGIGVSARDDATNRDPAYLRNRVRLHLLPLLEREFNPQVVEALCRTASVEQAVDAFLSREAHRALGTLSRGSPGKIRLATGPLSQYDRGLEWYVLRAAIGFLRGRLTGVSFAHVQALADLVRLPDTPHRRVSLPGSLTAYREGGDLVLERASDEPSGLAVEIAVPGTTAVPEFGLEVCARLEAQGGPEPEPRGASDEAWFDWDALEPPLEVRGWRPGDRFQPSGMRGSKKVQDFFVDEKIPRPERKRTAFLGDRRAIHWIIGHRTSEPSRVRPWTERVLKVRVVRPGP